MYNSSITKETGKKKGTDRIFLRDFVKQFFLSFKPLSVYLSKGFPHLPMGLKTMKAAEVELNLVASRTRTNANTPFGLLVLP